ncbi:primosomal protein N' [Candidatus Peregrinibacteria bacterium]|nr:primosomal protein N' [Candidatus Peregrinibacteria bacterium]
MKYAQVVILKKAGEFDAPLTYKIQNELNGICKIGSFVKVPLRSQEVDGIVIELDTKFPSDIDSEKIKEISEICDISIDFRHIELAKKIADYYRTSLTRSLRLLVPTAIWKGKLGEPMKVFYRIAEKRKDGNVTISSDDIRGAKQKEIVGLLSEVEELDESEINASKATMKSLIEKGIIEKIEKPIYVKPDYSQFPLIKLRHELNEGQQKALEEIRNSEKPILLHGITSSGKTEVYLRVILDVVKNNKQAILLVPEIALTPQMINYFKDFFGPHLALFHSKLSDGQRLIEWWKVKSGYAPLVIGSRSAIFAPAENLGVIILDEEHEWTYKQESSPYYQAHHIGEILSDLYKSKLILGSATPRLETMYKSKIGDYKYINLAERINKNELPKIEIIDLRDEFQKKNFSIFSLALQNKIKEKLEKKEQIILFVNQRGMASAVVCRDCGYTEECPHCEVSLKYHKNFRGGELVCHYCGFKKNQVITCPECKSPHIKHVGIGTQRVEEEVMKLYPDARVVRADSDTTSDKNGFEPIYNAFKKGDYDILVGTQMVAKGMDFENVSLIGIILADIGLHLPDFRSHERVFQLITQVSGRCGRGDTGGSVILQTYQPDNFAIQSASKNEYIEFIEKELEFREKLNYPPFHELIKFTVVGTDLEKLKKHIQIESEILEDIFEVNKLPFKIVFAPAMISKIAGRFYYHVLIRAKNAHVIFDYWKVPKYWRIDVDPIHTT